jgi:hypothetical protein
MDLEHVHNLTAEESSAECAVMCRKGSCNVLNVLNRTRPLKGLFDNTDPKDSF